MSCDCFTDIDECAEYADICKDNAICTNIEGSFLCAVLDCGKGYKMASSGHCEGKNILLQQTVRAH